MEYINASYSRILIDNPHYVSFMQMPENATQPMMEEEAEDLCLPGWDRSADVSDHQHLLFQQEIFLRELISNSSDVSQSVRSPLCTSICSKIHNNTMHIFKTGIGQDQIRELDRPKQTRLMQGP